MVSRQEARYTQEELAEQRAQRAARYLSKFVQWTIEREKPADRRRDGLILSIVTYARATGRSAKQYDELDQIATAATRAVAGNLNDQPYDVSLTANNLPWADLVPRALGRFYEVAPDPDSVRVDDLLGMLRVLSITEQTSTSRAS